MKLYWEVRDNNGTLLFSTERVADTPENRNVGKTLRKRFPSADGYSVARIKVHTNSETVEPDPRSHTHVIAVDCGSEGIALDDMIADMKIFDGVHDVRVIARLDHGDDDAVNDLAVRTPADLG